MHGTRIASEPTVTDNVQQIVHYNRLIQNGSDQYAVLQGLGCVLEPLIDALVDELSIQLGE